MTHSYETPDQHIRYRQSVRQIRNLAILLLVAAALASIPTAARADTFTVTSTADPGDGTCDDAGTGDGCTLREAIDAANSNPGADIITFDGAVTGVIMLSSGGLVITEDFEIQGPGDDVLTVDGSGLSRVFQVAGTVGNGAISGLTISGGVSAGDGGGILNQADTLTVTDCMITDNTANFGGGISNSNGGVFTLVNSTLRGNTATSDGGGIDNLSNGVLTIRNSSISGNNADDGGGIVQESTALTLTIENSTISGNMATSGSGGGVAAFAGTVISSSTITDNTAASDGGGVVSNGTAVVEVQNSIIAANPGSDVDVSGAGSFDSDGHNLIGTGNALASFNQTGDQTGVVNPMIGPLDDYGGPTETHALFVGSPAVDMGDTALPTDQRGVPRPQGAGDDIGAVEGSIVVTESLVVTTTADESDGTSDPDIGAGTSLREAIIFANSNPDHSVITFDGGVTGVITLSGGQLNLTSNIDIQGPGDEVLAVDGSGLSRVFQVSGTVGNGAISGLTISGGMTGGDGGGILSLGDTLMVTDCMITDNTANFGGGISVSNNGYLVVDNCVIEDNTAQSGGGGIDVLTGAVAKILNSTISGNTADDGGGIVQESSADSLTVKNTTIIDNDAVAGQGGGIGIFGGVVLVESSSIESNTSTSGGAGISIAGGSLEITGSTINGNAGTSTNVSSGAGGLSMTGGVTASLENSTVSGNASFGAGGGITVGSGTLSLLSSTVTSNTAPSGEGSGVKAIGTADVQNSIIAGNTTTDVDGAGFNSNGHNLVGDGDAVGDFAQPSDSAGVVNPKLSPLADNGGPTETHALENDSPAVDAGETDLDFDQRGFPRPHGPADDIGAFEFDATSLPVELSAFDVRLNGSTALLAWRTESETVNAGFAVEHRGPGIDHFADVGFVASAAPDGTTHEPQGYVYRIDDLDVGTHYFRLKQTDFDGTFAYSSEVTATVELVEKYQLSAVYPNPFNPRANFALAVQVPQQVEVALFDVVGRSVNVLHRGLLDGGRTYRFVVDGTALSSGTYVLRVRGENFQQDRTVILVK